MSWATGCLGLVMLLVAGGEAVAEAATIPDFLVQRGKSEPAAVSAGSWGCDVIVTNRFGVGVPWLTGWNSNGSTDSRLEHAAGAITCTGGAVATLGYAMTGTYVMSGHAAFAAPAMLLGRNEGKPLPGTGIWTLTGNASATVGTLTLGGPGTSAGRVLLSGNASLVVTKAVEFNPATDSYISFASGDGNPRLTIAGKTVADYLATIADGRIRLDGEAADPFAFRISGNTLSLKPRTARPAIAASVLGGHGTISPGGVTSLNAGESATYVFTPDAGYHVASITVDGEAVAPALSHTFSRVMQDRAITVRFEPGDIVVEIVATQGANGTITPGGRTAVPYLASQTYAITPDDGYHVETLTVNGRAVVPSGVYRFANVSSNSTLAASFAKTPCFNVFNEIPINSITPKGWLREFLSRQNTGLTGHHEELSYPFNTCLWAGRIPYNGHGDDWWPYEQTAYLSDGMLRLGYLLGDENLIRAGGAGLEYVLDHPMAKGRLGHPFFSSQWPMAVYFRAMQAAYSATRDPKLLEALRRHYLSYAIGDLTDGRNVINVEGMLWTYGKTGDPRLLELAGDIYAAGRGIWGAGSLITPNKDVDHGVTYNEMAKLPAIFYACTGNTNYLFASVNAYRKLDLYHMLPDGVPSSNEMLAGKDALQSHETCDISDYTWSVGYLLMASGDAIWADHIEKAIFNAGPGCVSKDFRNLQYFSSVNQVIATGRSNHNAYNRGSTWMAYWPCHETECCAGNVHRFMPNFVARMWMRDARGGLVAALYGPSSVTVPVGRGQQMTVTETTGYPFSDTITFSFETPTPVAMPFSFRIPGWCEAPAVTVNRLPYDGQLAAGTFVTLNRTYRNDDRVTVHLPMPVKLVKWEDQGVAVERGPLLFAYPVPETVTVDTNTYPNLGGKKPMDPVGFPPLDIQPGGPWNYALAAKSGADLTVVVTGARTGEYPLDPGASPVVIKAPARKVRGWALLEGRYTPPLPDQGKVECEDVVETITLVPYGSTRLRLGVFPAAGESAANPTRK